MGRTKRDEAALLLVHIIFTSAEMEVRTGTEWRM